jgi:hypothetical protein
MAVRCQRERERERERDGGRGRVRMSVLASACVPASLVTKQWLVLQQQPRGVEPLGARLEDEHATVEDAARTH